MNSPSRRWLIDLGNSRVKCAAMDEAGRRGQVAALRHDEAGWTQALLETMAPVHAGDVAWLASVAGTQRTAKLVEALAVEGIAVTTVVTSANCGSLRIAYADPCKLGVDRFLSMLAASCRSDGPWLVVSGGSALTVDLVGSDGVHHGGLIAPMPDDMRAALAGRFPQLDVAGGSVRDFATDTADAIASGAMAALLGVVERSLAKARLRLGTTPTLLACGGRGGELIRDNAPGAEYVPWLVLDGLAEYVRLDGGHAC